MNPVLTRRIGFQGLEKAGESSPSLENHLAKRSDPWKNAPLPVPILGNEDNGKMKRKTTNPEHRKQTMNPTITRIIVSALALAITAASPSLAGEAAFQIEVVRSAPVARVKLRKPANAFTNLPACDGDFRKLASS